MNVLTRVCVRKVSLGVSGSEEPDAPLRPGVSRPHRPSVGSRPGCLRKEKATEVLCLRGYR